MVIILKPEDDAKAILDHISQFLALGGMKVSQKKTKLTATTDGFDFLGWHFRVQTNGKFRCVPSADNFKAFRQKIKAIVNCSNYGATVKAEKLAPAGEITIASVKWMGHDFRCTTSKTEHLRYSTRKLVRTATLAISC